MKKLWVVGIFLFLFCLRPLDSRAAGWVWMNGTSGISASQLYDQNSSGWFYIEPATSANVVNMQTGTWWKLEESALRAGWSYWDLPWLYSSYNHTWYWMAPRANWLYRYNPGAWIRLVNHY